MEDSNSDKSNVKMHISFPKSDEDHRLQLVKINDSIFAILYSTLESDGPINLHCEDWSLILLAPIKSKANIVISAINIFCFNEISSEEATVTVHATNRLVKMVSSSKPQEKVYETGDIQQFELKQEAQTAAFLNYFHLFNKTVIHAHGDDSDSFVQAQQSFIQGLCSIAALLEEKREDLDIHKVLKLWNIAEAEETK